MPLDQVDLKDTGGGMCVCFHFIQQNFLENQHCKGAESQSTQKISEG